MKNLPKIQKSLKQQLTQESKDFMVKTAIGAVILSTMWASVDAASTYTTSSTPASWFFPTDASVYRAPNHTNTSTNTFVVMDDATCSHVSGIVNGHMSQKPSVNPSYITYTASKTHNSHSSHNSCWGGHW